jgi:hypothetical protein
MPVRPVREKMVASAQWRVVESGTSSDGGGLLDEHLRDVVSAAAIHQEIADFLLVRPRDTGGIFMIGFHRGSDSTGEIRIRELPQPTRVNINYATVDDDDLLTPTKRSHREFERWAGRPLQGTTTPGTSVDLLVVKVDPTELWFLRFPLGLYIRFHLGEFATYARIQWIVTDRTFTDNARNRLETAVLLEDTAALLRHTVVIVNIYRKHVEEPRFSAKVVATFRLLDTLLSQLQDVRYEGEDLSLRWLVNPSTDLVRSVLTSPDTRIVFAPFEAQSGSWEVAEPIRSLSPSIEFSESNGTRYFNVRELVGQLRHIQLMRVFHCHSAFDPFEANMSPREPGDSSSIVRELLDAGARLVEGGLSEETFFSFAASVIQFVFGSGLAAVIESRVAEGSLDGPETLRLCNELLAANGFPIISDWKGGL